MELVLYKQTLSQPFAQPAQITTNSKIMVHAPSQMHAASASTLTQLQINAPPIPHFPQLSPAIMMAIAVTNATM